MKSKRGQQDIIVTILLVLIVLTAIAFVAAFLMKNIKTSTASADDKQTCLKLDLDIASASATTGIVVTRPSGDPNVKMGDIKIFVNGAACTSATNTTTKALGPGASVTISGCTLASTNKVTAAPVLANNFVCDSNTEVTIP